MIRRLWIAAALAAIVAIVGVAACAQISSGKKAPDFTLKDLNGKEFKFSSCFAKSGKVVVLDIWATWCPPCRREIPHLIDIHKRYRSKGAMVIGVALDRDKDTVADFAKEMKINYTVLHDPQGRSVGELYEVRSIPQTYVIDRKGTVQFVHVGFAGEDAAKEIESEVKKLLAEK